MYRSCLLSMTLMTFLISQLRADNSDLFQHFAEDNCYDCHGEFVQESDFRLDTLAQKLDDPAHFAMCVKVYDRIRKGEMPPAGADRPDAQQMAALLESMNQQLHGADQQRQLTTGRVPLRRLNRVEYEYTLRDLLALPGLEIKEMLPPDPSAAGFDNVASAQELSYVQMSRYLDAAKVALDAAMNLEPKPQPTLEKLPFQKQNRFQSKGRERGEVRHVDEWAVFLRQPNNAQTPWKINNRIDIVEGTYRFRIRCQGVTYDHGKLLPQDRDHVASFYTREKRLLKTFDVPDEPGVVEFTAMMHDGDEVDFYCATLDDRNTPGAGPTKPYVGPGIAVEYLQIEGPLELEWPRASHHRLFGDLPIVPWNASSGLLAPEPLAGDDNYEKRKGRGELLMVTSTKPLQDAERLLRPFMFEAYRRPVDEVEVQRCLGFANDAIHEHYCFQDVMRAAYTAVLCSPDFLFFREDVGPLEGYALASRLSYFLWRSMPDETLFELAKSNRLADPEQLHIQVERMLNDPKAERFIDDFTGQWLDLREIGATVPDRFLFPEYFCDNYLVESTIRETRAYFAQMLNDDLGAEAVVDSDFAMVNGRLAELYDIPGVKGEAIRPVSLPKKSLRGGLLTQASVLKVTANGLTTSPVLRGVWVLDRLLGQKMPPPPPDAGAIEPDTRGATTIRELLDKHRRNTSCATCHQTIDPPGFALEQFDVMGGEREHYRSFEKGKPLDIQVADRKVQYKRGPIVDAAGQTSDGQKFSGVEGFRAILLTQQDQIGQNLVERLLTFATGSGISFADRQTVQEIMTHTEPKGYGIRSIIHEIVQSDAFTRK